MIFAAILLLPQQFAPASNPNHYWQQQVAYEISARLDEPRGVLSGTERIRYVNQSPDTLSTFSLHLYLNAFRPGSRWSDADSIEGRRRFNDLREPNFAFNHVRNVRIGGTRVVPIYPFTPDSTVVRFVLPQPLPPGDSVSVDLEWDARPSTVPRRQGRQGRRFDFAQWYPKVVVYDRYGWEEHPLYPAGEFYGEFATFLVDLDVPADQVIGATGVPVCGDPGWERANRNRSRPIDYRRDYYGPETPPAACDGAAAGRKIVRWYARDVHHFAISLNPDYRYEGGRYGNVAVHVLYQPGDESTWGGNVAVERTATALAWLGQLYGPFAWPQITNVHRIEGGGTEFPMMIMNGSAEQGLIVHELGHNYTMGILANNEWREGWLDEGFTSFQTDWFWEMVGRPSTYPETEAGDPAAGSGRLLRAAQPGGGEISRFQLLQHRDLHPGQAVLSAATVHRRRRDDAPDSPDVLPALEAEARGRGRLPRGGRGGVPAGPLDLLCPVAAHDGAVRLSWVGEGGRDARGGNGLVG